MILCSIKVDCTIVVCHPLYQQGLKPNKTLMICILSALTCSTMPSGQWLMFTFTWRLYIVGSHMGSVFDRVHFQTRRQSLVESSSNSRHTTATNFTPTTKITADRHMNCFESHNAPNGTGYIPAYSRQSSSIEPANWTHCTWGSQNSCWLAQSPSWFAMCKDHWV